MSLKLGIDANRQPARPNQLENTWFVATTVTFRRERECNWMREDGGLLRCASSLVASQGYPLVFLSTGEKACLLRNPFCFGEETRDGRNPSRRTTSVARTCSDVRP